VWFVFGPALFLVGQSLGPGAVAEDQWILGSQEPASAASVAALGVACLTLVPFAVAPLLAEAPLRVYRLLFPAGLLVGVFSPLAGVTEATLVAAGVGGCLGLAALAQRPARAGFALLGGTLTECREHEFLLAVVVHSEELDQVGVIVGDHLPAGVVAGGTGDEGRCRSQRRTEDLVHGWHVAGVSGGNGVGGHRFLLIRTCSRGRRSGVGSSVVAPYQLPVGSSHP